MWISRCLGLLLLSVCVAGWQIQAFATPRNQELISNIETLAAAQQTLVDGSLLASTCFGCHGPAGQSVAPAIPALAGLPEGYFIRVMQAYQYGGRFSSVMGRIVSGFTDDEIRLLARYFSQQETKPVRQPVDWSRVSKGRQLHRVYCRQCHGDMQQEPKQDVVMLNGNWMSYLRWTLRDYLIGINQTETQMSAKLTQLIRHHGNEGLESLIHYYGSLRP